jgi:outer membrane receptor protein involved in Fe transport
VRSEAIYTSRVPRSGTTFQEGYARLNLSVTAVPVSGLEFTLGVDNAGNARPNGALTELGRRWFAGLSWGTAW